MSTTTGPGGAPPRLRTGVVLRVSEDVCQVLRHGRVSPARYAGPFPSPRTERVSPGHLVALAGAPGAGDVVVFRWYDAVVLGPEDDLVRLWEPAHGEVLARPRSPGARHRPGARAHLSAGLPGAEWWVAGLATGEGADADVELAEVERFCDDHDLWDHPDQHAAPRRER